MFIAALLATFAAAPQAAPAKPAAPAASATPASAAKAAPEAAALSLDTPIETLVANPAAKAALDAEIPGIAAHPMYEQFKTMSLTQLAPMSNGQVSDAALAKIKTRLAGIK